MPCHSVLMVGWETKVITAYRCHLIMVWNMLVCNLSALPLLNLAAAATTGILLNSFSSVPQLVITQLLG